MDSKMGGKEKDRVLGPVITTFCRQGCVCYLTLRLLREWQRRRVGGGNKVRLRCVESRGGNVPA